MAARNGFWFVLSEAGEIVIFRQHRGERERFAAACQARAGEPGWAEALVDLLAEHGYAGESVIIGVSARDVLSGTVPLENRAMARDRQMLTFALEQQLPLAAEEFVCDFLVQPAGALGVAIPAARWQAALARLAENSIRVSCLVPTDLLVLQGLRVSSAQPGATVLILNGAQMSLLQLSRGRPLIWRAVEGKHVELTREVKLLSGQLNRQLDVVAVGASELVAQLLQSSGAVTEVTLASQSRDELMIAAASELAREARPPSVDLMRGCLGTSLVARRARRQNTLLAWGLCTLLLGLAAAIFLRGQQYSRLARELDLRQAETFSRVFPEKRVPSAIRARLQSEYENLAGLTGQLETLPALPRARDEVVTALASIPPELRFRLLEIVAGQSGLRVEAELREHAEADTVAEALRAQGFVVPPPRSENLPDHGVTVSLAAELPQAPN